MVYPDAAVLQVVLSEQSEHPATEQRAHVLVVASKYHPVLQAEH